MTTIDGEFDWFKMKILVKKFQLTIENLLNGD